MKTLLKIVLGLVLLLAISGAVLVLGKQPDAFADGSQSQARLQAGPYQVKHVDEVFIDTSRPTAANGDYPGDNVRTLAGGIWLPFHRHWRALPANRL